MKVGTFQISKGKTGDFAKCFSQRPKASKDALPAANVPIGAAFCHPVTIDSLKAEDELKKTAKSIQHHCISHESKVEQDQTSCTQQSTNGVNFAPEAGSNALWHGEEAQKEKYEILSCSIVC